MKGFSLTTLQGSGVVRFAAGEPFGPKDPKRTKRPRSVWSAIHNQPTNDRNRMALDLFGLTRAADRAQLMAESVAWGIERTNRAEVFARYWLVWIDACGDHKLKVYK